MQAKCLVYPKHGSPSDVLTLHSHSISPPHSNLLTLRTLAAPLNPADINQIQGTYPTAPPFTSNLGSAQPTAVPGNEACFEVQSAGSACKQVSKGDWVIPRRTGLGTWRTHLQVEEDKIMKIDKEGLTAEQVATVSVNPITAYRMLKDFTPLKEGDWFIQNGANSGVGRAAVQLGKMWGLKSICVVRKREGAEGEALKKEMLELGATVVVSDEEVLEKAFGEKVKEWTNGGRESVQLGLNCVGGDAGMAMAKVLGEGGTMVTYGAMSKSPMRVGAGMLIFKDLRFVGFWVSKWGDRLPDGKERTIDKVLGLIRDGKFKDVPMVEVPWSWETKKEELLDAVQGTLKGFRRGKGIFRFGDTFFPLFTTYIYKVITTIPSVVHSTNAVLNDFAADGVCYLELRTTPRASAKFTHDEYISTILNCITDHNKQQSDMRTYLILSVDRRHSPSEAAAVINMAIQHKDRGIVGIDLCGDPAVPIDIEMLQTEFCRAKSAGLGLTVHVAEVPQSASKVELEGLLAMNPDRIGHVIHVDDSFKEEIATRKIGLELCISCNVLAKMTEGGYENHHFGEWYRREDRGVVALCTDGIGIFLSLPSNEHLLAAQHFNLTTDDLLFFSEAASKAIFSSSDEAYRILDKVQ
ncbi:MAG: hypothetical protein Q9222_006328, partial [Ikaeria aurantiellina]